MVPLIVLIVVLAAAGGIAYVLKSRKAATAASAAAGTGPNEFLKSPPTSFPSAPAPTRALDAATVEPETAPAPADVVDVDDDDEDDEDDEVIVARFKAPGERSLGSAGPTPTAPAAPVYHLEAEPVPVPAPEVEPVAAVESESESEPEPEPEPEPELEPAAEVAPEFEPAAEVEPVDPEPEHVPDEAVPTLALVPDVADEPEADVADQAEAEVEPVADGPVIDLSGAQAVVTPAETVLSRPVSVPVDVVAVDGDDAAWQDVVLQPEPDAVDHVLQALINRARFQQVEVEAVATELVERADLQGQEVSEVLAELVGRADDSTLDAARTSELTLFNDEVPSRPGQLTDFARLAPAEKKRIIVRVLCLLVARSEDQQLPPRAEGETAEPRSWPLARAVWPLAASEADGEPQLPNRRLAKSG